MICFSPPRNPWPMVGDRTTMPRTRPLYSAIRYPSMDNVVVVSSASGIPAPGSRVESLSEDRDQLHLDFVRRRDRMLGLDDAVQLEPHPLVRRQQIQSH